MIYVSAAEIKAEPYRHSKLVTPELEEEIGKAMKAAAKAAGHSQHPSLRPALKAPSESLVKHSSYTVSTILAVLPGTAAQVASRLDRSTNGTLNVLCAMHKEGLVRRERVKKGRWWHATYHAVAQ